MDDTVLNDVCIIGCGYVGLPLAVALAGSKHNRVTGLDLNDRRIEELQSGLDTSFEIDDCELSNSSVRFISKYSMAKDWWSKISC